MQENLDLKQKDFNDWFEKNLSTYLSECEKSQSYASVLLKSQRYSLLSGGKRFRPFLAYLVFKLFSDDVGRIRNLCMALEMVHTYSLIHDDLPCMDNDDFRRGKPTNHKAFSEEIALLAGDGLLTDVFSLLSADTFLSAETRVKIIQLLSAKIGSAGMVSGQTLDMTANLQITFEQLSLIHTLKTANLIQAAAHGAALAAGATPDEIHNISEFSFHLGMAFQIKDDLLDAGDKEQDFKSYLSILGVAETQNKLTTHSQIALKHLRALERPQSEALTELVDFNLKRTS